MSNETDLDWLARNVHVWPAGDPQFGTTLHRDGCKSGDANYISVYSEQNAGRKYTKRQWLARRAELQNKPGWDHEAVPAWATALAQDQDGEWKWLGGNVTQYVDGFTAGKIRAQCKGVVLGSWRDTLERRPVDLSEQAVTQRLDEATQNVLAAVPGLMDEKYLFDPEFRPATVSNEAAQLEQPVAVAGTGNGSASESAFLIGRVIDLLRTSADHFSANELADLHQLCDAELTKRDERVCGGQKYIDAHWFERGELPPVGTECIFDPRDGICYFNERELRAKGQKVTIIAHTKYKKGYGSVAVFQWDLNDCCGVSSANQNGFRTIRTERENAIEVMLKDSGALECDTVISILENLLDNGWAKGAK